MSSQGRRSSREYERIKSIREDIRQGDRGCTELEDVGGVEVALLESTPARGRRRRAREGPEPAAEMSKPKFILEPTFWLIQTLGNNNRACWAPFELICKS